VDEPREIKFNSDGAQITDEGRIIVPGRSAFTPETAVAAAHASHKKRRENAIEAAKKGILAGLSTDEIIVKSPWGGMSIIIAAQARLAIDISKGNASTQAARFVLEQADILVKAEEEQKQVEGLSLDQGTALKLAELIMSNKSNKAKDQVIDA